MTPCSNTPFPYVTTSKHISVKGLKLCCIPIEDCDNLHSTLEKISISLCRALKKIEELEQIIESQHD